MEKITVEETLTYRSKATFEGHFTWGEVLEELKEKKIDLRITDVLEIGYNEGYQSSDSGCDPHFYLNVTRFRTETNEELERRMEHAAVRERVHKKNRYDQYLKLKKEFESEEGTTPRDKG